MTRHGTPRLDARDAQGIVTALLERLPAYVPGTSPTPGQPGWALMQVFARYVQALIERLNQAPDKNKLAFLDLLGINVLPAQAARAPVAFTALPHVGDSRVSARSRVGATVPGRSEPLLFETEQTIALTSAHLAEVVTVWPGKDAYADHSTAATSGQPFTLFEPLKPAPHELYLAHSVHFALAGKAIVELQYELTASGTAPLPIAWEYWDGKMWRAFKAFTSTDTDGESFDGTDGLTRSGVIRLVADCAETAKTTVNGLESYWLRGRVTAPMLRQPGVTWPQVDRLSVRTVLSNTGVAADSAYAAGQQLDLTKSFYPFGQQAQAGAAFYLSCQEAFSKPGARLEIKARAIDTPQEKAGSGKKPTPPDLAAEAWDGNAWQVLSPTNSALQQFIASGTPLQCDVPAHLAATTVNGEEGLWMRLRIRSGGFTRSHTIPNAGGLTVVQDVPPALDALQIDYTYRSPQAAPEACLAYNDCRWNDYTEAARWRGTPFAPFTEVEDRTPTFYLGFDAALPADLVGLYFDVQEVPGETAGPTLRWEYWDGLAWLPLSVTDETRHLALPGMLNAVWPGAAPPLARFGQPRTWMRARLQADGEPRRSTLHGIYLNAVWAAQMETVENAILGSGNAQPNQVAFIRHTPVLGEETIEVRELDGPRAAVELPILLQELAQHGLGEADVRTVTDRRSGRVNEIWVRWQERPNLFFSGPGDRHYTVERSRGRVMFGDNRHGRVTPTGVGNLRAAMYRWGGGSVGNVSAGAINQVLSGVLAQGVSNPRAAEGGADGEPLSAVLARGPLTLRHHRQALTLADYEALAREASPTVAVARALPTTHPSGRPAPGWVKVVIMPSSRDPQPQPSFELRRQVRDFLALRVPAGIAQQIVVVGPDYLPIGVEAAIAPMDPTAAGTVFEAVTTTLQHFLHPLTGGPDGQGWPFGRDVYLSDVARLLEAVAGVDYVATVNLLLSGTPGGEQIDVPADRIVVAGALRLTLIGSET